VLQFLFVVPLHMVSYFAALVLCYSGQGISDLGLFPIRNVISRKPHELATGHYLLKGYDKAVLVLCYPD
jgi:hypothetical protein